MENSDTGKNPGQEPQLVEFEKVPKQYCKECLGRGYVRYLSARVLNPDQSITEQFGAIDCRCIRYRPVVREIRAISNQETKRQPQPETTGA